MPFALPQAYGKFLRRTRKIRVWFGWLALIALGLTIVAPVISRTLVRVDASTAHRAHHGMDMSDMSAQMPTGEAHAQLQHDSTHSDHDGMLMEPCGYCGLLGHNPLLIVIAWLPGLVPQSALRRLPPPASPRGYERSALTAAPRGPPAFPHS